MTPKLFYRPELLNLCLTTTKWGDVQRSVGESRESELKDYWSSLLNNGATTARFTGDSESAQDIVRRVLRGHCFTISALIQELNSVFAVLPKPKSSFKRFFLPRWFWVS
jgi:hypothetical protein